MMYKDNKHYVKNKPSCLSSQGSSHDPNLIASVVKRLGHKNISSAVRLAGVNRKQARCHGDRSLNTV